MYNTNTDKNDIDYADMRVGDFLAALASGSPVPGGGGASALVGAVGTALGGMVAALTVGKKKYADAEAEMTALGLEAARVRNALLELIGRDAAVFEPLARAYGLPSGTPEEAAEKARVMEAALCEACTVPLEIMRRCGEALRMQEAFAARGSRLAISDAGVGAAFCEAAVRGASLNVCINTKAMADRERAAALNREADALLAEYKAVADRVFESVRDALR